MKKKGNGEGETRGVRLKVEETAKETTVVVRAAGPRSRSSD